MLRAKRTLATAIAVVMVAVAAINATPAHAESAVQVVSGNSYSCALTPRGSVHCWGHNYSGQLGDGSRETRDEPVEVVGLDEPLVSLTAGLAHTCGLTLNGGAVCWGDNGFGAVGTEAGQNVTRPTAVTGLESGVVAIDAGAFHTCAALAAGGVKCWGSNSSADLGIDTADYDRHTTPVDVVGLDAQVTALTGGDSFTCALTATGSVLCWGRNDRGALGDGGACGDRCPAVQVAGLESSVTAIAAASYHTCALLQDGSVRCWGQNHFGSLGNGTRADSTVPVEVVGLPAGVTGLRTSPSGSATCALVAGGPPVCWGMNTRGLLGDGTDEDQLTPTTLTAVAEPISDIGLSSEHTCVATVTGAVKCWGGALLGTLGNGTGGSFSTMTILNSVSVTGFGGGDTSLVDDSTFVDPSGPTPTVEPMDQAEPGTPTAESSNDDPIMVTGFENGDISSADDGAPMDQAEPDTSTAESSNDGGGMSTVIIVLAIALLIAAVGAGVFAILPAKRAS